MAIVTALVCVAGFLLMVLPYLPGPYDASAAALSWLAQVGAFGSLLFVPVGVAWTIDRRRPHNWRTAAFGVSALLIFVLVLGSAAVDYLTVGLIVGGLALWSLWRVRKASGGAPVLLIIAPLLLVGFRMAVVPYAASWSTDRAIAHSRVFIGEIEAYWERRGEYPPALESLHGDMPTGIIGVERLHYERAGDAYNLFFIRPSIQLDAMEVVLFNPRDEHRFTSHVLDILRYDGDGLDLRRGDRRRTPLAQPHWISILFD